MDRTEQLSRPSTALTVRSSCQTRDHGAVGLIRNNDRDAIVDRCVIRQQNRYYGTSK